MTAVLQAEDRYRQRAIVIEINTNGTVSQSSLHVSRGDKIVNECCMCETKQLRLESHVSTSAIGFWTMHFHPQHLCHQGRTFTRSLLPNEGASLRRNCRRAVSAIDLLTVHRIDSLRPHVPLCRLKYCCFRSQPRLRKAKSMKITSYNLELPLMTSS